MKRYSKIALIVGILLIIYSLVNYSLSQVWDWTSTLSLVVGLIIGGVGVYYILKFREREVNVQTIKYGTNLIISTVVFIGILVLVAFITTRHHARKDLTASGMFSLADQTKTVLKDLNKPVTIYGFYKASDQTGAKDMLDEYTYRSNQIHVEFIDPNEKPQIARQYQVTQYNTIVVESGPKTESITELNESNLTNAIMKVTRSLDKAIYFTTGHGEVDIEGDDAQGFKTFADGIKKENYLVKTINVAQDKVIPEDCSVLVVASPKADFFDFELDTVAKYLDRGGKLMALIDPQWKPALVNFLKKYKIEVGNNIVVDATGLGQLFGMGPEVPLVSSYEDHEIFKEFNTMTFYPLACSVRPMTEGDSKVTTTVLFKTSQNSWGESNYQGRQVSFNAQEDIKGPVPIAVVATKTVGSKKSQILVIGDSDFAKNAYIKNSGNYDLSLNMINWLAEEEDMITIRPKEIDDRRVNLTQQQSKLILYLSVIGLPLAIIIAGAVVYFKRR
jgi:ABC-type uncharacterized transport system involved in gliding motility auxiliary subunit